MPGVIVIVTSPFSDYTSSNKLGCRVTRFWVWSVLWDVGIGTYHNSGRGGDQQDEYASLLLKVNVRKSAGSDDVPLVVDFNSDWLVGSETDNGLEIPPFHVATNVGIKDFGKD